MSELEIDANLTIKCQWCNCDSALKEWNDNTYEQCTSREMKRAYTKLNLKRAFMDKSNTFYKCPKCGKWIRGNQLIIMSNDENLKKLGRHRIEIANVK